MSQNDWKHEFNLVCTRIGQAARPILCKRSKDLSCVAVEFAVSLVGSYASHI